jgi:hypothetical protein
MEETPGFKFPPLPGDSANQSGLVISLNGRELVAPDLGYVEDEKRLVRMSYQQYSTSSGVPERELMGAYDRSKGLDEEIVTLATENVVRGLVD